MSIHKRVFVLFPEVKAKMPETEELFLNADNHLKV